MVPRPWAAGYIHLGPYPLISPDSKMPILMLTGQGSEGYRQAEALNARADDYVTNPFDAEELIARLQALLRRNGETPHPILTWG